MSYLILNSALSLVLLSIAWNDFLYARIEHRSLGALLALYALSFAVEPHTDLWTSSFWCLGLLIVGFGLFFLGVWGGGDAKLLPILSLWVSPHDQMLTLYGMACLGGIMALIWVAAAPALHAYRQSLALSFRSSFQTMHHAGILLPSIPKHRHSIPTVFEFPYGVPLTIGLLLYRWGWV